MGHDLPRNEPIEIHLPQFKELELSTLNSSVVPVVVITASPASIHFVGTAFCIGSRGLWVTARHVLEGRGGVYEIQADFVRSYAAILWVGSGVGHDVDELLGGVVPIKFMVRHPASGSDLALIGAGRPNVEFPPLVLSARLPVPTVPIMGLGYAKHRVRVDEHRPVLHAENNIHASSGEVLQLFENGRVTFRDLDGNFTGKLPTVCFETSARFDSGMSGGPVLDPFSSVCGVISTGLEQDADQPESTSFASAMPYLFMLKVPYDVYMTGEQLGGRRMTLYEMVQRGLVSCDDTFDKLKLTERDHAIHVYYEA